MPVDICRRDLLATAPAAGLALLGLASVGRAQPAEAEARAKAAETVKSGATGGAWPGFPRQDAALVQEVVGASHRNEARVRELIDAHPALVNAAWDWGFGDWETPLGAAAHTGRRNIAELLISRGARVDIFAAAMLGWVDAVKGMTALSPGVQRAIGPHGLTLAHHARAGAEQAVAVLKHLEELGDADKGPAVKALADEERAQYEGTFTFGPGAAEKFSVRSGRQGLEFVYGDEGARRLHMVSDGEFFPSGVPTVRVRFSVSAGRAQRAVITDHDLVVTGVRPG
ncbi:MAG: hypothetical protein Q8L55_04575 [Phycisphaerales bacterium]|nr:hypothetical protein [Phycisphaerales bacterium]